MKTIVLSNQKGGVAKTTSTYNIAYALAAKGNKVLMIDLDPQASLTIYGGLEPYDTSKENTICGVLKNENVNGCIINLKQNLDIIPSRIELSSMDGELLSKMGRETILARALKNVKDKYDYCMVDCPPTLSLLTINALACADKVIIPCKTDYLAYRGIDQLLEQIEAIKGYYNPTLEVMGVLATLYNGRRNNDKEVLEYLREKYNVIGVIKNTAEDSKGMYDGMSITEFKPNSDIAKEYVHIAELISL